MPEEQPVISTAFETAILLPFYYGHRDPAPTLRVLEDGLVGNLGARGTECALAGIEVALPAGMGAGGYLHAHAVPRQEVDARRPQVYDVLVDLTRLDGRRRHRPHHPRRGVALPGARPQDAVGDADRPPVGIDVDEPCHEVRIGCRGGREEGRVDGTEDRVWLFQDRAGVDEHVWTGFDAALVSRPGAVNFGHQDGTAYRRDGVIGIVVVAGGFVPGRARLTAQGTVGDHVPLFFARAWGRPLLIAP